MCVDLKDSFKLCRVTGLQPLTCFNMCPEVSTVSTFFVQLRMTGHDLMLEKTIVTTLPKLVLTENLKSFWKQLGGM